MVCYRCLQFSYWYAHVCLLRYRLVNLLVILVAQVQEALRAVDGRYLLIADVAQRRGRILMSTITRWVATGWGVVGMVRRRRDECEGR